jgi:hypothetical protein
VRGTEKKQGFLTYDPIRLSAGGELEAGKWHTLTLKIVGDNYTITAEPALKAPLEINARKARGPVALFLERSSEVHIEWIKVGFPGGVPKSFVEEAKKQDAAKRKSETPKKKNPGKE